MTETNAACNQEVVCVLGMHRSGTSLLTRILNLIGVELGSEDILTTEPAAYNPKGYWEHNEFTFVSDEILKRHGGSWDAPPTLPTGWEASAELDDLRLRARQLIRDQFAESPLWGWKDPRSCLTLPFWQQLLPNMRYIICLRNPADVARSLEHRDGHSVERSSGLWFTYVSSAMSHSEGKPCLVIFYEDIMDDCIRELRRLAEFLGRPERARQSDVRETVRGFVEKGLQHHRSSLTQANAGSDIDPRARALYVAQRISVGFGRKENNGGRDMDKQIYKLLDASTRSDGTIQMLVAQHAEQIRALQSSAERAGERERALVSQLQDTETQLQKIVATSGWRLLNRCWHVKHVYFMPVYRLFHKIFVTSPNQNDRQR